MEDATGIKIYRSAGTEGTCPKCHGGNAMLGGSDWDGEKLTPFVMCRDCAFKVIEPEIIEVSFEDLVTQYRNGVDNNEPHCDMCEQCGAVMGDEDGPKLCETCSLEKLDTLTNNIRRLQIKMNKLQNDYRQLTGKRLS